MALKYLLDTNICIYIAKQQPQSVLKKFQSLKVGEVAMSAITYGEMLYGVQKSQQPKRSYELLQQLAQLIPPLSLSTEASKHYGKIRSALELKGQVIGNNDLWISAHCLDLGAILVTNNTKEFSRVPGLSLENWVEDSISV